ncbi:MAG TPA: glycosyltransferase 87 family protein [Candidatus Polarisedimenticolia bacterium]|nr:glycosyltransferase 87 family protein [Candidatus Polarisedimenticolia bacterium]
MKVRLWLLLSIFAAGISSLYVHRILGPWSSHSRQEKGFVIAQISDLYSPWVGTRELLLRRRNPYGPEVSHEIQTFFYGHVIHQTYAKPGVQLVDEQRFAYPIYEVFITAPLVYADFADVQRWAPFALGSLLALNVLLCFSILHLPVRGEAVAATVLFVLSSPQIVQGLRLQQLATVEACLLIAGAWCISRNHLTTAGALFAFSTIKPQMGLLPLCWFAVWAAGDWHRRWRLPASFIATLAALFAAGELLLPGWLGFFLAGLAAYRRYALPTSLLRLAMGDTAGQILGGLIVLAILVFAWRNRHVAGDSPQFVFILAAFFMATVLTFPLFTPFNQVLLILPAMLLIQDWKSLPRFSRLVFIVSVSWPWIVSLVLLLFRPRLDFPNQLPLLPSFLVSFFPLLLPLLLMTRRSELAMPPRRDTVLRAS